jgi:UPF0755 protein
MYSLFAYAYNKGNQDIFLCIMDFKAPLFRQFQQVSTLVFIKFLSLSLLIVGIFLYTLYGPVGILKSIHIGEGKFVVIPRGANLSKISDILEKEEVISAQSAFMASVFLSGNKGKLKSGEYALPLNATPWEIAELLASGKTVVRKLTIVEGSSVHQVIRAINEIPVLVGEITRVPEEGFLMPDTYLYAYGDDRQKILDQMETAMQDFLVTLNQYLENHQSIKNHKDLITLASLVEKETALGAERPVVAAVYLNRLKINMPLQCDPTVIYSLTKGEKLDRQLTKTDLNTDSPYNTYRVRGLPKGPIGCPGKASIRAVLNPSETKALYFVANGKGGHEFAENLFEHNNNVKQWRSFQRKQRNNEMPSPQNESMQAPTKEEVASTVQQSEKNNTKSKVLSKQVYKKDVNNKKLKLKKIVAHKIKKKRRV